MISRLLLSLLLVLVASATCYGQSTAAATTAIDTIQPPAVTPPAAVPKPSPCIVDTMVLIPRLDFAGISLFDALTTLARGYNLSIYIDSSVTGKVSLRLDNVTLNDALLFIIEQYGLQWSRTGGIIRIFKSPAPPPPAEPLNLDYADGMLSVDLQNADLRRLIDTLVDITGRNIVIEEPSPVRISGKLKNLEFEKALRVLLSSNGLAMRAVDNIVYISRAATDQSGQARARNLMVRCDSGRVTVDASGVQLGDVVALLAAQCAISVLIQTTLEGYVSAQFSDKPIDDALTYLLMNSKYTFTRSGDVILVGDRTSEDLYDSRLVTMNHVVASQIEPLIPVSIGKQLSVKVVPEHNGLLVTGPRTAIARLQAFLQEVDIPPAQVLFDVLVVDYNMTNNSLFRITANNSAASQNDNQSYWPGIDLKGTGESMNNALRSLERRTGWSNLGILDDSFFIRLEMLAQEGKAIIQSHPQIATLNGHSASIKIGTTQYYLLESETIYPSQQSDLSKQTSQRFETIQADMSLVVTPHVSPSGELIVEIAPEFTTPTGDLNADVPPTLNRRVLESTVRLQNGETIVLGGLIQNVQSKTIDKFPILGSLPLLGPLFQNRKSEDRRSELMIYVTPYVYFGSEGTVRMDSVSVLH